MSVTPKLQYAFTLHVHLAPPQYFGNTAAGERRFIPITGGKVQGPKLTGTILAGGGDWNAARTDGVVHIYAKYSIQAEDGTLIVITNEGYGRASQQVMNGVFGDDPAKASMENGRLGWYTKTCPKFEVAPGQHGWLNSTCFVGDLLPPTLPNHVEINIYEIE
ncbi:hypothetical protein N0V91_011095 [Didymella pomorum]|jgi:hypothetical protein|uniref:Uncharacterized protein n=1 Tax=Didymella pomorum TaxID=749634 RepID=A0A9W8YY51_9PLEO|nr:hypothetical protein N0V91_011095 [Didymella pomorum]